MVCLLPGDLNLLLDFLVFYCDTKYMWGFYLCNIKIDGSFATLAAYCERKGNFKIFILFMVENIVQT